MSPLTCTECGGRVDPDQTQCDLCGWSVNVTPRQAARAEALVAAPGPFCNDCGGGNPAGARFCSHCGKALQVFPPPAARPRKPADRRNASVAAGTGRQVALIFGLAALLIVALFMITAISKQTHRPDLALAAPPQASPAVARAPLSAGLSQQVAALDNAIAEDTSLALEREKVFVLAQGGRTDLAAEAQQNIARRSGEAEDWRMAGNLYFDWMIVEEDPSERSRAAGLAVTAYQAVLTRNPDNHDVRTDMATAYLSTGNPMLGVTAIKQVLEAEPDHLNANFNYGLMLARINRTDQALEQLTRVLELSPDTASTHNRRAQALMASIRGQAGS
ncbi:MAG: zinc ribbon domain-containing protein [Bacteroidota bacterium]|nr:zinc ribbon domain-containing protein [Bacteroidota bacterium]MDE2958041.1 zinc ribbon domain-containing protein [Bacteroidota bacterium]